VYDAQASNGIIMRFEGNPGSLSNRTLICSVVLDQTLQPKRCDVLKIDVEGAEGLALKGGIHTIRNHRPVIFSEFSPPNLERVSGMSGEGYLAFLFSEGYSVSVIEPSSALAGCGQDVGKVMDCFKRSGGGHIDLLATQAYPAQYH
jgi:Methyltransferase FkbM domain